MMPGYLMDEVHKTEDGAPYLEEVHRTPIASQIITSSFAACFYLSLLVISVISLYHKTATKLCSSVNALFVFFLGLFVVVLATITNSGDGSIEARQLFRILTGLVIGIVYMLWGTWRLFEKPASSNGERYLARGLPVLGNLQPSMGLIITCITFPLIVIELIILVGSKMHDISIFNNSSTTHTTDGGPAQHVPVDSDKVILSHSLHMSLRGIYLVQKIVQALVYSWLRSSVAVTEYKEQAIFFFRVIAFLNFAFWLDSITYTEIDAELDNLTQSYGSANGIIEVVYDALVIDYRLLCSLLFLEHSFHMEVSTSQTGYLQMQEKKFISVPYRSLEEKRFKNLGVCCGLTCLLCEIIVGLHYKKELGIGPEVHLLAIAVDVVIIFCGFMLVTKNDLEDRDHAEKEPHAVDFMVCCMGCTGFICWMVKGSITSYWASCYSDEALSYYMNWASAKLFIRAITVLFLIFVFNKVKLDKIANFNQNVRWNYFLIPFILLGMLAIFIGSAVDQYIGIVDEKFKENDELLHQSIRLLFHVGPPFHLGFCIHLFLHFLLIQRKMGREWVKIDDGQDHSRNAPLLGESFEYVLPDTSFDLPDIPETTQDNNIEMQHEAVDE